MHPFGVALLVLMALCVIALGLLAWDTRRRFANGELRLWESE